MSLEPERRIGLTKEELQDEVNWIEVREYFGFPLDKRQQRIKAYAITNARCKCRTRRRG